MNSGLTIEYFCEMEDCLASLRIPIFAKPSDYGWVRNRIFESPWVVCPKHKKASFQERCTTWALECFGKSSVYSLRERFDRFIEESVEFAQSYGIEKTDVIRMVDYVYSEKKPGKPNQELGGVMVTLGVLCESAGLDMNSAGEEELLRILGKIDEVRQKNETKPRGLRKIFDE